MVRSFEEARRILLPVEKFQIKTLLLRAFITVWLLAANSLLYLLRFILFETVGDSRKPFNDIVVYSVGIFGDNVVMLPALAAIRRRYPKSRITVISNCQEWSPEPAIAFLKPLPYLDQLIIVKDYDCPVQRHGWHFKIDVPEVKDISCDLFVNLSPFGNRGWLGAVLREMLLARNLGPWRAVGFHMSTYTRRKIFNKVQHYFVENEPRRSRKVLKELGLSPIENKDLLPLNPEVNQRVLKKLTQRGGNFKNLFVRNPGAKFECKCWPAERFGAIARWLASHFSASVILTGTPDEKAVADEVVRTSVGCAINLVGETTVTELAELLRMAKACITNDTGTMHLAALTGAPMVAIFTTRLSPTHWFPAGNRIVCLFSLMECSYCYEDYCETNECLKSISTPDVTKAIEEVLEPL